MKQQMKKLLALLVLCTVLFGCVACTPSSAWQRNAEMERSTYNAVINAEADRQGENLQVGWLDYINSDDRLTLQEKQRFADTAGTWDQWIRELERQAETETVR